VDNVGKAAVAEFVGTVALIFFGAGAIVAGGDLVAVALAHGLAIAIMVSIMAHISGGVFNPAIQIALLVTGKMPGVRSAIYIVAQCLGAIAAAFVLKYVALEFGQGGIPAVAPDYPLGKAVIVEAILTFFLVWAVFGTAVDSRGPFAKTAGLTIGLVITIDIFMGAAITGAAMNPARWLGPAVATGEYANWWVWLVGPIAGGIIAGVGYWTLFLRDRESATP
jgi:MIP family channel proteins